MAALICETSLRSWNRRLSADSLSPESAVFYGTWKVSRSRSLRREGAEVVFGEMPLVYIFAPGRPALRDFSPESRARPIFPDKTGGCKHTVLSSGNPAPPFSGRVFAIQKAETLFLFSGAHREFGLA